MQPLLLMMLPSLPLMQLNAAANHCFLLLPLHTVLCAQLEGLQRSIYPLW